MFEVKKFYDGEMRVRFTPTANSFDPINLVLNGSSSDSILEILLKADAVKRCGLEIGTLHVEYLPYSRQDRIETRGECLSLAVIANLINSVEAKKVILYDPHSDVASALIKNVYVVQQHEILRYIFEGKKCFWLVSPDGGALKKIYKLADRVEHCGVIECSKRRSFADGSIYNTTIHCCDDLQGKDCYIVDDICNGAGTFIEIAKLLKKKNPGKIILAVSHFKPTRELSIFNGFIDQVYSNKGLEYDSSNTI